MTLFRTKQAKDIALQNRQFPIRRRGVRESPWEDGYHRVLRGSWSQFFLVFTIAYLLINFVFAIAYSRSPGAIAHIAPNDYLSFFAFSVETMATIGYGYFYPLTPAAHILVTLQTIASLFFTALLTGLVFAKFSKPAARIVFSQNILLTTQNGRRVLSLRLGNVRTNQIYEGKANLTLLRDETSSEGEKLRRLVNLELQRDQTPLFALSWTLFHVIDETSPLFNMSYADLSSTNWDFIATFSGFDQDMGQTISAMTTYSVSHLKTARKFKDMISLENGLREIDFAQLHEVED